MALTVEFLQQLVSSKPGLSARRLAYLCREQYGLSEIRRKHINSILYSYRNLFTARGSTPPQWFISSGKPSNSAKEHEGFVSAIPRELPSNDPGVTFRPPGSSNDLLLLNSKTDPIPTALNEIEFRPWQLPAVNKWKANGGCGVIEAVTGTGKTHCGLFLVGKYVEAGKRVLILVPTIILLRQWVENLRLHLDIATTHINTLGGGDKGREWQRPITIGIVNSVYKNATRIDSIFSLLIADECHRYASASYQHALLPSIPHRLGLTATLERSDDGVEEALIPYFKGICFSYTFKDARHDDVIAPYSVISIGVDLTEKEREKYDYLGQQMRKVRDVLQRDHGYSRNGKKFLGEVTANRIRGRHESALVKVFTGSMSGRKEILSTSESKLALAPLIARGVDLMHKTVVFCETTESADRFNKTLSVSGIKSCSYHSGRKPDVLNEILEDLADGDLDCLVAVRKLDEGVDINGLDMGVILAGTRQRRQMIQRLGRIIRKKDDSRTSVCIHVYARGTSEDPELNQGDDTQNIDLVYQNATHKFVFEIDLLETNAARVITEFEELIIKARKPVAPHMARTPTLEEENLS